MIKNLFISIFLLGSFAIQAQEASQETIGEETTTTEQAAPSADEKTFYEVDYVIEKDDTFASILKKYVKEDSVITAKTPMIHKTRSSNPHIKKWGNLEPGQKVKLYISKNFINLDSLKAYKKREKLLKARPKGYHSSLFYMASAGSFNQKDDSTGIDINFTQNSLLSLGYTGLYYPKGKPYNFSGSAYFSSLNASESNLNQKISVSPEIGITGNMEYSFPKYSLYGGFDFERFFTFNTEKLLNQSTLLMVETNAGYLTFGVNKLFRIWGQSIFSKFSLSKSIMTSTDFTTYTTKPSKSYDGLKAMFYLNYKFKKKWFAHTLVKYHTMEGPDNLSVLRLGLGVGFIIN